MSTKGKPAKRRPEPALASHRRLADEIKRRRLEAGLTHGELALETTYSREYVGRTERPEAGFPSADLVQAIDDAVQAEGALIALHAQAEADRHAYRRSHKASREDPFRTQHSLVPMGLANSTTNNARSVDISEQLRHHPEDDVLGRFVAEFARAVRAELDHPLAEGSAVTEETTAEISAVRSTLLAPQALHRTIFKERSSRPGEMSARRAGILVEHAWAAFQRGLLGNVIASLPQLILTAQDLEVAATPDKREGWAVSARSYHLAATTLCKIGETDLGWIAAERAMRAADQTDDLRVLASAARAGAHALLAVGRFEDAMELGQNAVEWLRPQLVSNDPAALSLLGMLHLRMSAAAARKNNRSATMESIQQAQYAADRLGRDDNYWQTSFGPTNVELHRISAFLELGDIDYVVRHGPGVSADGLPVERRVSHMIDVARALSSATRDEEATQLLLEAEEMAPHLVRRAQAVQGAVSTMYRRTAMSGHSSWASLGALAERCGATA